MKLDCITVIELAKPPAARRGFGWLDTLTRRVATHIIMDILGGLLVICAGCISKQASNQLGEVILTKALAPPAELGASVIAFRLAENRWPKDREELSTFIKHSNGKLEPIPYEHVDFTERQDGSIEIHAASPGMTNSVTITLNMDETKPK